MPVETVSYINPINITSCFLGRLVLSFHVFVNTALKKDLGVVLIHLFTQFRQIVFLNTHIIGNFFLLYVVSYSVSFIVY